MPLIFSFSNNVMVIRGGGTGNFIESHLNQHNLDVRKTHDARFMDQKVTPDVLCFIADCIVNLLELRNNKCSEFTSTDIWKYEYFNENIKFLFSKPDVHEDTARNEYDKFINQPLRMLNYAKVLVSERRGRIYYYKVNNYEILQYISLKEQNAYNFTISYLYKVLEDSNIIKYFEKFRKNNTKDEFFRLKQQYIDFIIEYTKINGKTEASRIFTKVLNPYCVKNKIHGTMRGSFSPKTIQLSELMYNRTNWRDTEKDKSLTRHQYSMEQKKHMSTNNIHDEYKIEKSKRIIKRLHNKSEVDDDQSNGNATQVHHIFMKNEFPEIAALPENLILLTPNQHYNKAHPNNNTNIISLDYQLICLLSKSKTIEAFSSSKSDFDFYSKENFVNVINTGLNKHIKSNLHFAELNNKIKWLYGG